MTAPETPQRLTLRDLWLAAEREYTNCDIWAGCNAKAAADPGKTETARVVFGSAARDQAARARVFRAICLLIERIEGSKEIRRELQRIAEAEQAAREQEEREGESDARDA